jgi:hypothetical protein
MTLSRVIRRRMRIEIRSLSSFFATKYREIQKNHTELDSNYSREKDLWENKFEFLEDQRNLARGDLTKLQKKFELTMEGFQRRDLVNKDRSETSSKAIITMLEERYKNQLRELSDNSHKNLEELKSTIRSLEEENRSLLNRFTNKTNQKTTDNKELNKLLAISQDSERRLKNELAKVNEDYKTK